MGALTNNTIADTYKQLLKITSEGVGANASAKYVEDGLGTDTALSISTTRVGIGTASPGSPLDVESSEAANTANFNSTSGATNITLESSGSLIGQMEFVSSGTSQIVTRTSASLALGSNNVKTLYITDDDRVGIGSQGSTLIGYADASANNLVVGSSTGDEGITIISGASAGDYGALYFGDANRGTNGRVMYEQNNEIMSFYTNNTEKMRITLDGKMGIGQTTVNAMLDIDDDGANTGIGVPQIRVGSINNTGVYGLIGFGWGGNTTYSPVTIGGLGTSGSGSVEADFVINTRDGTSDAVPVERMRVTHDGNISLPSASQNIYLGGTRISGEHDSIRRRLKQYGSGDNYMTFGCYEDNGYGYIENYNNSVGLYIMTGAAGADLMLDAVGAASLKPYADVEFDLGESSYRFADVYASNGTIQTSDKRMKDNIKESSLGLDFINKLNPVQYKWKDYEAVKPASPEGDRKEKTIEHKFKRTHYGLIAQEVEKVLTDSGLTTKDFAPIIYDEDADRYGMRYTEMIGILVKAIQELSDANDSLKLRIEELKTELQDTKDYVDHKQDYNSMAGRINSCEARIASLEKE